MNSYNVSRSSATRSLLPSLQFELARNRSTDSGSRRLALLSSRLFLRCAWWSCYCRRGSGVRPRGAAQPPRAMAIVCPAPGLHGGGRRAQCDSRYQLHVPVPQAEECVLAGCVWPVADVSGRRSGHRPRSLLALVASPPLNRADAGLGPEFRVAQRSLPRAGGSNGTATFSGISGSP